MSDQDQYAQWDAAYVLGALAGAERAQYEEHLAGCTACRAAVAELAGLPGLLGQLSPAEAIAVESDSGPGDGAAGGEAASAEPRVIPEPPASLMPPLSEIVAVPRRWLAPVAAAAAAVLIGGIGGYAVSAARDDMPGDGPSSTLAVGSSRLAFAAVSASPMTAVVDVVPTGRGTEVRVECQYAPATATATGTSTGTGAAPGTTTGPATGPSGTRSGAGDGNHPGTQYAIWVVGRDGREMQVKEWTARSGRVMRPSGVTSWSVEQIESVEIRLADTGDTVLRAQVS